tara:strand:- start:509 stop:730 length:222 start_codon:yes stop_codon:yes gene_type:complete
MKSLSIDVIFSWEIGLVIVISGLILLILGVTQSKADVDDFDKIYFVKPTTKILFGFVGCIFGSIQLLPLLKVL